MLFIKIIAILSLFVLTNSCKKKAHKATLTYYFKTTPSTQFDSLKFSFGYTRAYIISSTDTAIASVYLEPQPVTLNAKTTNIVKLGNSVLGFERIVGYNFFLNNANIFKNNTQTPLVETDYWEKTYTTTSIEPKADQNIDILFEIVTDSSIVKLTNGNFKFFPVIKTTATVR